MNSLSDSSVHKFVWFDDRQVLLDHTASTLPAISIACAPSCDFACPHCIYNAPQNRTVVGMSTAEKTALVENAAAMGCRFLQICHEAEPFCDPTTMPVLRAAARMGMLSFMFTHGANINREEAEELHKMRVCLGVKCDSLDEGTFNRMLGTPRAKDIYAGIDCLLSAGYGAPFERDGRRHTRLSLVCTVTEINLHTVRDVARFCWKNDIFFNVARLEKGGRANRVWERMRVKDASRLRELIDWCSDQTGIDYRYAQPSCYCIGACGLQVNHNGDAWITQQGCGCDLTEPDGITYPETQVLGNVRTEGLKAIVGRLWDHRRSIVGELDARLQEYVDNLESDSNVLAACGGSRTHFLFRAYKDYVSRMLVENVTASASTGERGMEA